MYELGGVNNQQKDNHKAPLGNSNMALHIANWE